MLRSSKEVRFSQDHYVDLHDATIRAAPDRLCISVNSLYKLGEDAVYDLIIYVLLI